jgi:hypothetical protein
LTQSQLQALLRQQVALAVQQRAALARSRR